MKSTPEEIPTTLRWICTILALIMILAAGRVFLRPPERYLREFDATNTQVRLSTQPADVTAPFLALFIAGVALFVFGVNGLKITKISAGDFSAQTSSAEEAKAETYFDASDGERSQASIEVPGEESPAPTESPSGHVSTEQGEMAVYKLGEVPTSVISDVLSKWPAEETGPENLGLFEFASRKTGQGNNPWIIKFKGRKAVLVSYGGYAKTGPTVATVDTE